MIVELFLVFTLHFPDNSVHVSKTSFVAEQTVEQCNHKLKQVVELSKGSTTTVAGECLLWDSKERMPSEDYAQMGE